MTPFPTLFRPVTLPSDVTGHLLLHAMPGRHEPYAQCLTEMQQRGITRLVSLTPLDEIAEQSPDLSAALIHGLPIPWEHYPIVNYTIPDDPTVFYQLVRRLSTALRQGETLLVHCRAGIGRTGTLAICLLLDLGLPLDAATQAVYRAGSGPETTGQRQFVAEYANYLKDNPTL